MPLPVGTPPHSSSFASRHDLLAGQRHIMCAGSSSRESLERDTRAYEGIRGHTRSSHQLFTTSASWRKAIDRVWNIASYIQDSSGLWRNNTETLQARGEALVQSSCPPLVFNPAHYHRSVDLVPSASTYLFSLVLAPRTLRDLPYLDIAR